MSWRLKSSDSRRAPAAQTASGPAQATSLDALLQQRLDQTRSKREWRTFLLQIAVVMLVVYLLMTQIAGAAVIHGDSMEPALHDNDVALLWRLDGRYESGDIVMFQNAASAELLVKRVIAGPGDTVELDGQGNVIVNDVIQDETNIYAATFPGSLAYPITLEADQYYVLGDNRSIALDSRDDRVGAVEKTDILCKVVFVFRLGGNS